ERRRIVRRKERVSRDLQVVAPEEALMRMYGVVAQIEVCREIDVREHDVLKIAGHDTVIHEGKTGLEIVKQACEERAETAVESDAGAEIAVAEQGIVRARIAKEHRIHVEFGANRSTGACFEQSGLAKLGARAILEKESSRRPEGGQLRSLQNE